MDTPQLSYSPAVQQALSQVQSSSSQPEGSALAYHPEVQKALDSLGVGPTPQDLTNAQAKTGSADYNGLCQKFVEEATGSNVKYPTAVAAWNAQLSKAHAGLEGAKPGDLVYFAPDNSNEGAGHAGILSGKDSFISATDSGVQTHTIADWQNQTKQKVLGYIHQ